MHWFMMAGLFTATGGHLELSSDTAPPLLLDGPAALSVFALAKIQAEIPSVVYAEFVHVLQLRDELSHYESRQVHQLLTYGPTLELPKAG